MNTKNTSLPFVVVSNQKYVEIQNDNKCQVTATDWKYLTTLSELFSFGLTNMNTIKGKETMLYNIQKGKISKSKTVESMPVIPREPKPNENFSLISDQFIKKAIP